MQDPIWESEEKKNEWLKSFHDWLVAHGTGILTLNELVARPFLWGDFTYEHAKEDGKTSKMARTQPRDDVKPFDMKRTDKFEKGLHCYCNFVGDRVETRTLTKVDAPFGEIDGSALEKGEWTAKTWEDLKRCAKDAWKKMIRHAKFSPPDTIESHKKHAFVSLRTFSEMCLEISAIMQDMWSFRVSNIDTRCAALQKAFSARRCSNDTMCDFAAKIPHSFKSKERVIVIGDIHGGFRDLFKILDAITDSDLHLAPDIGAVVFLGDIVDRSYFSLETLTLAAALFARNRMRVFFVKGNHESPIAWIGHATSLKDPVDSAHVYKKGPTLSEMEGHRLKYGETSTDVDAAIAAFDQFTQATPIVLFASFANGKRVQFCHGAFPWHATDPGRWNANALHAVDKKISAETRDADVKGLVRDLLQYIGNQTSAASSATPVDNGIRRVVDETTIAANKRKSILDTNLLGPVYTNITRPGVSHADAVEWCARFDLHGIYSGHQDFVDVGVHLPYPTKTPEIPEKSYSHIHTDKDPEKRDRGGMYLLRVEEPHNLPQIVVTSTAVDARDASRERMRVCFLTLVLVE